MVENKNLRTVIHYLPIYGSFSTGLLYTAIGVMAMLSLLKIKEGGADESSMMAMMEDSIAGQVFIFIVLTGGLCFVFWRIIEAYKDPYKYGSDYIGIGRRIGIGLSSLADAFIVYSGIMVVFGATGIREDGEPEEEREMVGEMLEYGAGEYLIIAIGVLAVLVALVQFYYGVTKGYDERVEISHFTSWKETMIHVLAWVGYFARGIIIGIIGYFYIEAGFDQNPEAIVNTDKAFNFLGEEVGKWAFSIVAIGTVFYGLFMFAMGITYDHDNQEDKM
ncbi:DUF1206 domain-containing protein [Litoribacter ruber]|uniref:DUF1206 domain-containing protein n=1 Tax=Litoribacter ruber TaxID=702568 RepID=A0AAP2G680_9BACT|nr:MULTISPECIES: DUF1206 domain-containing protein [Litoribacter]MBS9525413.1 DUF1206 domain-containing protein [Litoribacter alkaliphilus]MBT0810500.1 DUF1206 domain-containing protein [Litoribacter ruber]